MPSSNAKLAPPTKVGDNGFDISYILSSFPAPPSESTIIYAYFPWMS